MQTIKGQIEKISKSEGMGKNGKPYVRWVLELNGKKYSTFNADDTKDLKIGDFVRLEGDINGTFFNTRKVTKISQEDLNKPEPITDLNNLNKKQEEELIIKTFIKKMTGEISQMRADMNLLLAEIRKEDELIDNE